MLLFNILITNISQRLINLQFFLLYINIFESETLALSLGQGASSQLLPHLLCLVAQSEGSLK